MDENIKILICYHKPAVLLRDNILTPIHVGRALANKRLDHDSEEYKWLNNNLIGDDTGDNISEKNNSYNEMTALYWAWKNYDQLGNPEYIGMMHYRRHFILREGEMGEKCIDKYNPNYYFDQIGYSEDKLRNFIGSTDFIVHLGKVDNVYKHYCDSHKREDLDRVIAIIRQLYPDYTDSMNKYFAGRISNFCNMFILRKELFFKYCKFVFSVLEEFEKQVDISEKRLFISERVTGVFFSHLMSNDNLRYKVVPISFIDEPVKTKIIVQKIEESTYPLAVTINSIVNSKRFTWPYEITIISNELINEYDKNALKEIVKECEDVSLDFSLIRDDENIISAACRVYGGEKKCLILSDGTVVLNDLSRFFSAVSVDDYYVIGVPVQGYYIPSRKRIVSSEVLVLNLVKIRQKNITQINTPFTGYIPDYYATAAGSESDNNSVFDSKRSRKEIIKASSWKRFILYDDYKPWENPQKPLSIYWWEEAKKLPVTIAFPNVDVVSLVELLNTQQKEVNGRGSSTEKISKKTIVGQDRVDKREIKQLNSDTEDWRSYSMVGKLKFYYKHNGLKQTVIYCYNKYLKRSPAV